MEIQPEKQNLDQTFSTTVYFIDFYQRDYRWTEEPVRRLLDDVFYQFDEAYADHESLEPNKQNVNANYPWYYLNTYVTNHVGGLVFVVDGQQRLTTLTLVLIKLLSLARAHGSKTEKWIEHKIAGYSGTDREFWMKHARHISVLEALMEGEDPNVIDTSSGITAINMVANYKLISSDLDTRLQSKHAFETFAHYFLFRLVLINLSVDSDHVPMVFEVINDRGVRLRPYEILKGKLLGQIDKLELENGKYNELWDGCIQSINTLASGDDGADDFFKYWLKAKFAENRKAGQRFDSDYHREMFKVDLDAVLKLDHNAATVKAFLKGPFRYYSGLYQRLLKASQVEDAALPSVFCNYLNELDSQYLLILSACKVDDPEELAKAEAVAAGVDRMFAVLQLQGAYDSNSFATRSFEISKDLRDGTAADVPGIFHTHLLAELTKQQGQPVTEALGYALFRPMLIHQLNKRFQRYLFARIELALAQGMKQQMRHPLKDLVTLKGTVNGFHIEHVLSRNKDNLALFDGDDERFDRERNRLGGVLLLKGKDNVSSSNEPYTKKLASYANTLLWNETLRADSYKSKLDFAAFTKANGLKFRALDQFGPDELEERHRLLFELCRVIWAGSGAEG